MEVRIGIKHAPRELTFETDTTPDEVRGLVSKAVTLGELLSLSDTKGRQYLVNADSIAYVELGERPTGRVGFVS